MTEVRRRHRRVFAMLFLILVLLPFGIVFAVMYHREQPVVTRPLMTVGLRTATDVHERLSQIDQLLGGLLRSTSGRCDASAMRVLRGQSFFHPHVRQVGLFDSSGQVICTTWGAPSPQMQEPALGLTAAERAPLFRALGGRLILSRLVQTHVIPSQSLIASRRRPDGSGANALLAPELLDAHLQGDAADSLALLRLADGAILTTAGLELAPLVRPRSEEVYSVSEVELASDGSRIPAMLVPLADDPEQVSLGQADYAILVAKRPDPVANWTDGLLDAAARASLAGAVGLLSFLFIMFLWRRRFSFEGEIKAAIARDELFVEYQPIIDVFSGYCVAAEALIRWQHPEKGRIRPDLFIDVAERTGLLTPMTDWLIKRIIADMTDHSQGSFPNIRISINLAASHFRDMAFLERTYERFRAAGINPRRIAFELTERSVIDGEDDGDGVWHAVTWLRERGFKISLDDFGTGYCNISQLQKIPIDYIKIDRSFVHRIEPGQRAPLFDSIVNMARSINVPVIAEGVETDQHHNYLREMGVEFGQGYRYAKPLGVQWLRTLFAEPSPEPRAAAAQAASNDPAQAPRRFGHRRPTAEGGGTLMAAE